MKGLYRFFYFFIFPIFNCLNYSFPKRLTKEELATNANRMVELFRPKDAQRVVQVSYVDMKVKLYNEWITEISKLKSDCENEYKLISNTADTFMKVYEQIDNFERGIDLIQNNSEVEKTNINEGIDVLQTLSDKLQLKMMQHEKDFDDIFNSMAELKNTYSSKLEEYSNAKKFLLTKIEMNK